MLPRWVQRIGFVDRLRAIKHGGAKAPRVPDRWVRRPEVAADARLCLFVMLVRGGRLLPHSVDHARAWADAGYKVVAILVVDALDRVPDLAAVDFTDGVLLRENRGYDFGAWAAAICHLTGAVRRAAVLVIANDSMIGPARTMAEMVARAEATAADVVGLTESLQFTRHLQSFVLMFKPRALASPGFWSFWTGVRSGDRDYVISRYELALQSRMEEAGLTTAALYPAEAGSDHNPTLSRWRQLLTAGFPYLKIALLRGDQERTSLVGWRAAARAAGFEDAMVERQLDSLVEVVGGPWLALEEDEAPSI